MKDLAIALEDRPGALAEMGEALGRASVSIEGGGATEPPRAEHSRQLGSKFSPNGRCSFSA